LEQPRCIALTGVDTYFGRLLVERLAMRSDRIRLVGLDSHDPPRSSSAMRFHRVDLTQPGIGGHLAEILGKEHVDTIVHLAFKNGPSADRDADHEIEVAGSLEVLNACAEASVGKLIIPSTTMGYGPRLENAHQLYEDAPLYGHDGAHWVSNRVQVERAVARFRDATPGCEVTVLRHCWIMGPRYVDPYVRYFEADWVPTLLGFDPLLQFVHEDDLLDVLETSILESHPGVFNVVGEGVQPLSGYLRLAGKRNLALPKLLLSRIPGTPIALSPTDALDGFYDYLKYIWVASGERLRAEFGPLAYSSREAWSDMITSRRLRQYR
jgi:UDP-glucose 4-epimerase